MSTETQTSRTLVKSPPELWAECSDANSLARHLEGFGEIRITRLEPETAVAWEGERASGTVRLESSGWGTKVTLTARPEGEGDGPARTEEPAPPARRRGVFARLFRRGRTPDLEPDAATETASEQPDPVAARPRADSGEVLAAALESLGQAHRRPFTRG